MRSATKGLMAIGVAMLMLAGVFTVAAPAAAAQTNVSGQLTTETGATDAFGGGDHFYVKFGSDAAFGVVWGTPDHPNNVYFVSLTARYLGFADIVDQHGGMMQANHTIKVYTLYAVKLDDLLEYNDSNGNGHLPYYRSFDSATGTYTTYTAFEPIYKRASLSTAWNASAVQSSEADGVRDWTFNLTASNLPYQSVGTASTNVGDGVLNQVKLSLHLQASTVHVDNATLPQWRVMMDTGPMGHVKVFSNVQREQDHRIAGNLTTYQVKWDKQILGWDFDPNNTHPTLLAEFETVVGNYIPALGGLMEMLQYERMIAHMGESGSMMADTGTSGTTSVNDSTGQMPFAKQPLRTPRLTFGGDWSRIGAFDWVTNVTVGGTVQQAHAQVSAAYPLLGIGLGGRTFVGFAALVGISYPGGASIVQDPTVSAQALTEPALYAGSGSTGAVDTGLPAVGLAIIGVILVFALLAAFFILRRRPRSRT